MFKLVLHCITRQVFLLISGNENFRTELTCLGSFDHANFYNNDTINHSGCYELSVNLTIEGSNLILNCWYPVVCHSYEYTMIMNSKVKYHCFSYERNPAPTF